MLPPGLENASKLPAPIFTPATKAEMGEHDENIDFEQASDMIGADLATRVRDTAIRLYREVLEGDGMIDEAAHVAMDAEIAAEIDDAVAFARKSPFPERTELSRHMFA
jgi:phosphoribosylaminoimidazole-succinocarboxamide synthase